MSESSCKQDAHELTQGRQTQDRDCKTPKENESPRARQRKSQRPVLSNVRFTRLVSSNRRRAKRQLRGGTTTVALALRNLERQGVVQGRQQQRNTDSQSRQKITHERQTSNKTEAEARAAARHEAQNARNAERGRQTAEREHQTAERKLAELDKKLHTLQLAKAKAGAQANAAAACGHGGI